MSRKKEPKVPLPWYRAPNYDGNLTEDEKRELDPFRYREKSQGRKHPAVDCGDLPNEVTMYISKLEIERYGMRFKKGWLAVALVSAIGAFVLRQPFCWISLNYTSPGVLLFAAGFLVVPWFYYPIKWRKKR